jgi:hypothetical protein
MKGLVRFGVAAAILLGLLGFGAVPASATHVRCGQLVTHDTKLDSDLVDCPPVGRHGAALRIGADGVTLDLNGHTISSNAEPIGTRAVDNRAGFDRVTVKNGTMTGFDFPIFIEGGVNNTVTNVAIQGNWGVFVGVAPGFAITKSTVRSSSEHAIDVRGPGPYLIENNVVHGYNRGIVAYADDDDEVDVSIQHNVASAGVAGITLATGINPDPAMNSGAVVEHNVITDGDGFGIFAERGVVTHNRAERNLYDGIRAFGSTVVSYNTANYNGDLGINAEPTVIDGGGNKAKGNGDPLQCVNVFCK